MASKIYKFINCKILRCHSILTEDLWVCNGKIIDGENLYFSNKQGADIIIDMKGTLLAPGFIDIQINGGYGFDFAHDCDNIETALDKVAIGILSHGVTAFCPTLVTSKSEVYKKVIPGIKKRVGGIHGAEILGVHVEGPFINLKKKGAHSADDILDFEHGIDTLDEIYGSLENIVIVTLAPEKKHGLEVISYLKSKNVSISLGHSEASFEEGMAAVLEGANLITHLFNAMLPFHHRDPGLVGLLSAKNITVFYGIIADGVHTHPSALRIAYKTHPDGVILVTDAISAMGLLDGTHHIGEKAIEIRGDHAFIADTKTLCGSIATMNKCVKYFKTATNCTTVEALEAASLHPAKVLGLSHKKGSLHFGADADFVALDDNLNVLSTWISGQCVWFKE